MKWFLSLFVVVSAFSAQARVEVLFHPHDPTLEKIAEWISEAQGTVDIAMYNMETTQRLPVIQELTSPRTQAPHSEWRTSGAFGFRRLRHSRRK